MPTPASGGDRLSGKLHGYKFPQIISPRLTTAVRYKPAKFWVRTHTALEFMQRLPAAKMRVLVRCHNDRNVSEYEGRTDVDLKLVAELTVITTELADLVKEPNG